MRVKYFVLIAIVGICAGCLRDQPENQKLNYFLNHGYLKSMPPEYPIKSSVDVIPYIERAKNDNQRTNENNNANNNRNTDISSGRCNGGLCKVQPSGQEHDANDSKPLHGQQPDYIKNCPDGCEPVIIIDGEKEHIIYVPDGISVTDWLCILEATRSA